MQPLRGPRARSRSDRAVEVGAAQCFEAGVQCGFGRCTGRRRDGAACFAVFQSERGLGLVKHTIALRTGVVSTMAATVVTASWGTVQVTVVSCDSEQSPSLTVRVIVAGPPAVQVKVGVALVPLLTFPELAVQ